MKINAKSIKEHILENKLKLLLVISGYIFFIASSSQLEGAELIAKGVLQKSIYIFFILYALVIAVIYSYLKVSSKIYTKTNIDKKKMSIKDRLFNGFILISMGAFLGFLVNLTQGLIVVTFQYLMSVN